MLSSTFQPPEEGRSVQQPKRCDKHGVKDEDNSLKNVNNIHAYCITDIKMFDLEIWFNGISNLISYLIPNSVQALVGVVCILFGSVDMHLYFTGIAPNIISSTNTTQNFTIAWNKWNRTQQTLNNKQFNMHITEYENK